MNMREVGRRQQRRSVAADSMILLPSMPCDATAAAMAASRSGASHTARAWGRLMVARAGSWRMSVIAQHGTTPSTRSGASAATASA